ncbi:hypothetical protein IW147_000773 [Coemansia sp. RSA 720]|nr:hypothetical protein IW147_000773 [Coemansia sp. RSA 720]
MSDRVASGVANGSIAANTSRVLGSGPMAGIVMSTHHADETADQLSSQTAGSPYHYTNHKDTEAQGSAYTDVETDPGTDAAPNGAHKMTHRVPAPAKTNGASAHTPAMGMRKRGDSRAASHHIYRYRSHASAKSHKPLVDPRLYRRAFSTEPTHSHYEKAMRRSAHRLVSATTRFDRVTTGALSLLADIARMYLMRLGEACKARADLANRAEPNLYDVADLETGGLGIEWNALREWADEWKAEVGDVTESTQTEDSGEVQSTVSGRAVDSEFDRLISSSANDGDIYDIIGSLDLERLLLGDQGVIDDTETIIPPHLPPLVSMADEETPEEPLTIPQPESAEDSVNSKAQVPASVPNGDSDYPERPMSPESESEETPESITAHMLHLASSSLSALPPTVTSNKALYAFFRPATKADPSCAPEDVLPSFDIPDSALTPAPEYIKDRLSRKEKLPPGVPMFLAAESPQRDVLGDIECQWREARHKLYDGIYEEAAERAIDEMSNAPIPMRKRRASDASEKEAQFDLPIDGEEDGPVAHSDNVELDVMDDDVVVMDLDMDLDLDLDIMNVLSDGKTDGDASELEPRPHTNGAAIGQPLDVEEPVNLPKSNGLRGSGAAHWSNEWFTPAMGDRLSQITAQDILPCDSLFMSSPTANQRHVVDEVARAFVDSEGGGHMHETTPLEGFGPPANIFKVPSASGSALRWTLHHIMQTRGLNTVDSLYAGRASLAGGIAGDGIDQYATRVCSLIKGSAEEEAALVVNGARADPSQLWTDRRIHPGPELLVEQLVAGVVKRIPWAQERMDIHTLEARVVGREPQPAITKQVVLTSALPPTPAVAPASPGYLMPVDHKPAVDHKTSPDHKALSAQSTPLARNTPPADNVLLVHSVASAHTVPLIQNMSTDQNPRPDQTSPLVQISRPDQTPPLDTNGTHDP